MIHNSTNNYINTMHFTCRKDSWNSIVFGKTKPHPITDGCCHPYPERSEVRVISYLYSFNTIHYFGWKNYGQMWTNVETGNVNTFNGK